MADIFLGYTFLKFLIPLFIINALLFAAVIIFTFRRKKRLEFAIQELQEKVNIMHAANIKENKNTLALKEKISRYEELRRILERIDQNLDLNSVASDLVSIVFSLLGKNKGVCILYLLDAANYKLNIFKTAKENKELSIKAKEGDIFDKWVLKRSSPLLIEDTKRDFRFDAEKVQEKTKRNISSLISSPMISDHRLIGVLRLDNPKTQFYTQDDLRFLSTISGLGAVALENSELFQKTQELAIHDELTSLYTKRYFLERLRDQCAKSIRHNRSFSLLMLDIDYFKKYNDRFGHTSGDIVLKNISENILNFLKDSDGLVSRFGGEEFCVILRDQDKQSALKTAEKIRSGIEKNKIILRQKESNITISIGVATFPSDAGDAEELIRIADRAMYEAKKSGRNKVCII
ncbi:MAG: hypothetical protein DRP74_04085 [Candidatus Omnitrophota bacterium]|nr:MAG: hypothetical protein DRP74_04085 [Candidatus Omnitrophota bacterium]